MGKNCFQCGAVIEDDGIEHRGKIFCSDECCEEFEDDLTTNGGPDLEDLGDDLADADFEFDGDEGDDLADADFEFDGDEGDDLADDLDDEYAALDDDSRYDP